MQNQPPQNQSHNAATGTYIVAAATGIIILIIGFLLVRRGGSTTPPGPTAHTPTPAVTRTINPCPAAGCIATRTPTATRAVPTVKPPTPQPTVPPVSTQQATVRPPTPQGTIPIPVGTTGVK